MTTQNLYQELVEITSCLLGPASERFIARQIHNHLSKEPHEIVPEDLVQLVDWIKLSMSLLTDDIHTINDYEQQLRALAIGD